MALRAAEGSRKPCPRGAPRSAQWDACEQTGESGHGPARQGPAALILSLPNSCAQRETRCSPPCWPNAALRTSGCPQVCPCGGTSAVPSAAPRPLSPSRRRGEDACGRAGSGVRHLLDCVYFLHRVSRNSVGKRSFHNPHRGRTDSAFSTERALRTWSPASLTQRHARRCLLINSVFGFNLCLTSAPLAPQPLLRHPKARPPAGQRAPATQPVV